MVFKKGDKVKVTANKKRLVNLCLSNIPKLRGREGIVDSVSPHSYGVRFDGLSQLCYFDDYDLELVKSDTTRTFDSGATRDTIGGKLSYIKALSPIVLRRYVQYLDKHRKQSDGSMRGFDNWKQGMPKEIYLDSLGRHFIDTWLLAEGYSTANNHDPVEIEDAVCAVLFNAMGWLHEHLKEQK